MATKFADLRQKMGPERRAKNRAGTDAVLLKMSLQEIRQQLSKLSQDDMAGRLDVTQGYVSRLERRDDITVQRLREFVTILGGKLEIRVTFPRGKKIKVTQYDD